ncbi:MAG: hypothetical protein ACXW2E_01750 [Nitrososphaeraceae archaeon]
MTVLELPFVLFSSMFLNGIAGAIFSTLFVIAAILLVAVEGYAGVYVSFVVYLVLMMVFSNLDIFGYIYHNPADFVLFCITYFLIGAVYSIAKYRSECVKDINKVQEVKQQYINLTELPITTTDSVPESHKKEWFAYLKNNLNYDEYRRFKDGYVGSEQKARIMNWIVFWPFSAVGLLVADPLRKFVEYLYRLMTDTYNKVRNQIITTKINMSDFNQ